MTSDWNCTMSCCVDLAGTTQRVCSTFSPAKMSASSASVTCNTMRNMFALCKNRANKANCLHVACRIRARRREQQTYLVERCQQLEAGDRLALRALLWLTDNLQEIRLRHAICISRYFWKQAALHAPLVCDATDLPASVHMVKTVKLLVMLQSRWAC